MEKKAATSPMRFSLQTYWHILHPQRWRKPYCLSSTQLSRHSKPSYLIVGICSLRDATVKYRLPKGTIRPRRSASSSSRDDAGPNVKYRLPEGTIRSRSKARASSSRETMLDLTSSIVSRRGRYVPDPGSRIILSRDDAGPKRIWQNGY